MSLERGGGQLGRTRARHTCVPEKQPEQRVIEELNLCTAGRRLIHCTHSNASISGNRKIPQQSSRLNPRRRHEEEARKLGTYGPLAKCSVAPNLEGASPDAQT